jgi:hypothetical protein
MSEQQRIENGLFVNSDGIPFAIINGSAYELEPFDGQPEPGYYEKAFDPDEPRDEQGRWTEGGGGGGGSAPSGPGGGDKLLLVSERPNDEKLGKWLAQLEAHRDQLEKEGKSGEREDDQVLYMTNALKEYRAATSEQLESDRVGLNTVYGGPRDADETKLLSAALTRYNPDQGVARVTISGGIDADAHAKALEQVIARYGSKAERIEAAVWEDDKVSAGIYEKAGFKAAGVNALGMTRLVWGQEGQTEKEKEAAERLATVRKNEVESKARIAAAQLDFDPDNVHFTDEDKTFKLNGKDYHFAGSYMRGESGVTIYHKNVALASVPGITAHEIGHRKFDALRTRYRDERDDVMKEPGPPPDPNGQYWWQKNGGHDAVMAPDGTLRAPYDKKYPVYHAWSELDLKYDKMKKDDGVSDYSKEYWDGFAKGDVPIDKPFHETIAEMSRRKLEEGKLPGSKEWKQLYGLMDKVWSTMTPTERNAARPLNEPVW